MSLVSKAKETLTRASDVVRRDPRGLVSKAVDTAGRVVGGASTAYLGDTFGGGAEVGEHTARFLRTLRHGRGKLKSQT